MTATGYCHPDYARSFFRTGAPELLERAGGWLLRRPIGSGPASDLAGPYPLFLCRDLSRVPEDLAALEQRDLASIVFVLDPFYPDSVERALPDFDLVRPFKTHQIVRLDRPWQSFVRRSCRKSVTKARRQLEIRRVDDSKSRAEAFWRLYSDLMDQHRVNGMQRLSSEITAAHLSLPGLTLFEACKADRYLGFASFVEVEDRVYGHLMAMSREGRESFATHGLLAAALDHYHQRFEWLDLGGNPGAANDPDDGVLRFKQGWTTETRSTYLCGAILNRELYESLCTTNPRSNEAFFPAYRSNES